MQSPIRNNSKLLNCYPFRTRKRFLGRESRAIQLLKERIGPLAVSQMKRSKIHQAKGQINIFILFAFLEFYRNTLKTVISTLFFNFLSH